MASNVQPLTGQGTPTKDDVYSLVEEHNVEFLRLQFTDIVGQVKNVSVPINQLDKAFEEGIWFDGSSIEGFVRINESDMRLEPDASTFAILPWTMDRGVGPTARMICDVMHQNGGPFVGDPRYVLKSVLAKAEEMGFTLNVGPEAEFFLFKTDENGNPTTTPTDSGGYFDLDPVDAASPVRKDINVALARMGFEVEASHHEVAAGQHEIDFKYADALTTADRVATFRTVVRTVAQQHGWHATFMPKPIAGINGSGMHCHLSLFDGDGNNAMFEEGDDYELSKTAYHFLGGVLDHARAITAVANPTVNSYKRLVPGYEAPVYVAWSNTNRSALVRIPRASGKGKRIELRSPDPTCNPYLGFAAMLAAGLDGIQNATWPGDAVAENIYEFTEERRKELGIPTLPGNLGEALTELENDDVILGALGEHVASKFIQAKRAEWDEYRTQVSAWEIGQYLATY